MNTTPTRAVQLNRRRFLQTLGVLAGTGWYGLSPLMADPVNEIRIEYRIEVQVRQYLETMRLAGILDEDERTAWSIYDLSAERKLVSIHENTPFQSASMIKPFVALAYFFKLAEQGSLYRYDAAQRELLQDMIKNSSNSATNYFINLVAGASGRPEEVERILKANAPDVFKDTFIIERIPLNGRTYLNKASARDYTRFLHALWHERFPYSQDLKALMHLPNKDRIFSGAKEVATDTLVYDKTGSTARLCGNMGILVAKGKNGKAYPYSFVAIIEKAERTEQYPQWSASRGDIIREVSNIVYTGLKAEYDLL